MKPLTVIEILAGICLLACFVGLAVVGLRLGAATPQHSHSGCDFDHGAPGFDAGWYAPGLPP